MPNQTKLMVAVLIAALFGLGGCASQPAGSSADSSTAASSANALATVSARPELSTFANLIKQAGLEATLQGGTITVFAPTNEAFKAVPAATLDKLAKDPELLKATLSHHVLPSIVRVADVEGAKQLVAIDGTKLNVSRAGEFLTVDEGLVTQADLASGNGVVHVVDTVLMPPKK